MPHRSSFRLFLFVAVFGLIALLTAGAQQDSNRRSRKYKLPPPTARIEVTILRDSTGKPIENASVIFHSLDGDKTTGGGMELKTNEDGKTVMDVLPIGDLVRLQIIAKGFQTYGFDYKIDKPELTIEIRMKRPGEQYSIYKHSETSAAANQIGGSDAAPTAPKAAPTPSSKPAETSPTK